MKFALIENNIITNVIVADNEESISTPGYWVECPKDLWIGDNYQEYTRKQLYIKEADPLFFKWQRGEATQQEWLDKIAEIKAQNLG